MLRSISRGILVFTPPEYGTRLNFPRFHSLLQMSFRIHQDRKRSVPGVRMNLALVLSLSEKNKNI